MAMQPPSSSSSSSSSSSCLSNNFSYDVFISFRGTDTRHNFTGNLYKALCDKGIRTFIDDKELQRGDEITSSLHKKIEDSRISVIVFSENYATSSFCLDELVHIFHCSKEMGRLVLPVFYGVEPSHVRYLNNSYGEALAEFEERFQNNKENMERLQKWKIALNQAANLSGYHYSPPEYEYKFIEKIVEDISNKTNRDFLHVAKHPVGLQSHIQQVKLLLDEGSKDEVHMVGLHGAGGMGKSTLAKAIFNFIADQFEGSCFLEDVKENSTLNNLKHLQENILMKTVRSNDKLGGVSEGITKIKKMLCQKKILLILDDVDKPEQLEALAGGHDWFGGGSRVIITTRDTKLLTYHGIDRLHHIGELYDEEAHELLRLMAFKNGEVPSTYGEIFSRALTYVSGLPLAIVTIGSNLFGRSVEDWERILDEYEKIPNKEIQRILKVSYDALEEKEKSVFLDIACCFKGCKWTKVKDILHAHYGHCIKHHVEVLAEKSLINHRKNDSYMTLHDLIEDMGKEVVRQESPNNPGKRSRLWFHDDIVQVLKENSGTSKIEMIYLKCPSVENVIEWNGKAFKKMRNLKTLIIKNGHFSKGPEYLPHSLRFWKWKGYPSASLLCVLNKTFEKMKILKIDNCECLTHIPDVSCLPNLEKISFKNCKSLTEIHDSIGFLRQLQILILSGSNIKILPESLKNCLSVKCIVLDDCKTLEEIRGIPPNLIALSALRCKSLTSSSKSMLMSQELHEAQSIECCFPSSPSEAIPEWFEHQTRKSISFSFRNNLPSLVLLFSSRVDPPSYHSKSSEVVPRFNYSSAKSDYYYPSYYSIAKSDYYYPSYYSIGVYLIINDNVYNCGIGLEPDHTYLFPFNVQDWYIEEYNKFKSMLDEALLKNEWIHAEVRFCGWKKKCVVESGIHVIKHLTSMDDFQFTDSSLSKNRISDEYLKSSRSVMKLPSDEDISAVPPRYRVLRTFEDSCALM